MSHKHKIAKLGLVSPIIATMFPIGAEDDDEDLADENTPVRLAFQAINSLATTYPPQQVYPEVMAMVQKYIASPISGERKAAMLAIAVLTEGCSDYIRQYLSDILVVIHGSMQDTDSIVRKAACMALGSLCDDLGDEVAEHHETLLPVLFNLVSDPDPAVHPEALQSLDVLLEVLSDAIVPYLPQIMNKLVLLLETSTRKSQILATNCIGSAAHSSEAEFMPYFHQVVARLRVLMTLTDPADLELRGVATDAMGAVAYAIGKEAFTPYLVDTMQLAIAGMQMDNERLVRCAYVLYAVLARLFSESFAPFLDAIVPPLLASCHALEKEFTTADEFEDKPQAEVFNITSGIANEKEIGIETLGDLFTATRGAFMPFIEPVMKTALELLEHYHEGVRNAAVGCLLKCASAVYSMSNPSEWTSGLPLKSPVHENVKNVVHLVMNGILVMISEEEDRYNSVYF